VTEHHHRPLPAHPSSVQPPALPEPIRERWTGAYWPIRFYVRGHLFVHGLAFLAIAASMWLEHGRYTEATLRGLIVVVSHIDARTWAAVFGVVGAAKIAAGFAYPKLARLAIVAGAMLLCAWAVGFVFAWLFDSATILGPVAWVLLLGEHVAALTLLDGRRSWAE
jgi:hypothetical protein